MDIADILKCKCCSDIFPDDIALAQPIYMALMVKYHPDKCSDPRAPEATAVINELYGKLKKAHTAKEKLFHSGSQAYGVKYLMDIQRFTVVHELFRRNSDALGQVLEHSVLIENVLMRRGNQIYRDEMPQYEVVALFEFTDEGECVPQVNVGRYP